MGSGILFDTRGLVLTEDHVVAGANAVQVTLDNGNTYPAQAVGPYALFDLAVLRVEAPEHGQQPTLALADSSTLNVGDEVVAIGCGLTIMNGRVIGLITKRPSRPHIAVAVTAALRRKH